MQRFRHQPVQDRGYRTRRKVLDAARKILVHRGCGAARVEEITKLARVGYGTFYKYFRNKQDVLDAVMEEVYTELHYAAFPSQLEVSHLEEQIKGMVASYLLACSKNREVLIALHPAGMLSPRIRKFLDEMREGDIRWMVRELERLTSQGWKISGNPEVFSLVLLHTMDMVVQEFVIRRSHLKLEDLADTLCEILFRLILPSTPPAHVHNSEPSLAESLTGTSHGGSL